MPCTSLVALLWTCLLNESGVQVVEGLLVDGLKGVSHCSQDLVGLVYLVLDMLVKNQLVVHGHPKVLLFCHCLKGVECPVVP